MAIPTCIHPADGISRSDSSNGFSGTTCTIVNKIAISIAVIAEV